MAIPLGIQINKTKSENETHSVTVETEISSYLI